VRRVDARGREVEEAGVARRALHFEAGVEEELPLRLEPVVVRLDALHHVLLVFVWEGVGRCIAVYTHIHQTLPYLEPNRLQHRLDHLQGQVGNDGGGDLGLEHVRHQLHSPGQR
jgi:hypothetical protein